MSPMNFVCPMCKLPLEAAGRSVHCTNGHSFDIAREGYVNLIPSKAPRNLQGDSAEMVRARQAFLARGLYQPLATAICDVVAAHAPRAVADIGCGEGYYLRQLALAPGMDRAQLYGTDISKAAVAAAAKRDDRSAYAVADTNQFIPLGSTSMDVAMCVFAPRNPVEFARIIRSGGQLIVAIPGTNHLESVRERFSLIGIESDKTLKITEQLRDFELSKTRTIATELTLDQVTLRELLEMTPNARHLGDATRDRIHDTTAMVTRAIFEVLTFIRN